MIIEKASKNTVIVGADLLKETEEVKYYLSQNPKSKKQRRGCNIVFEGTKAQCKKYIENLQV